MNASQKFSESLRQGERRIVTVIFADVSGFTAMSEKLDPEDVRDIMNRCFSMLSQAVYEHKGVVDKYVGDCVMALFGVPQAQEDDAVRAVHAALKMQSALKSFGEELKRSRGFSLSMRIGINTGLVIAGDVGSSQKSDFTVMGDAVNTASRIEHSAAVGKVWISRETHRFVKDSFRFKKLEPMAIKGKEKKLQFYEIVEPSAAAPPAHPGPGPRSTGTGRMEPQSGVSSSSRPAGASRSQGTVPGAATGAAGSEGELSKRQRAELCYEIAANYFRQGDDSEALSWIGKVSQAIQELGIPVDPPSGEDIHELMPVFSFLTEKN